MTTIFVLLFDEDDREAHAILAALSEGGVDYTVRRPETAAELHAWLADGPIDVLVTGQTPNLAANLDAARKTRPEVPVVVVARRPGLDNAVDTLRRGASNYIVGERLDKLAAAVIAAVEDGKARRARIQDEAERARLYKDAVDATRRRDAFLARVGQELRAPLNALVGWAGMLRARKLDEDSRERALRTIEACARAQARRIDDLVDISRILTGDLRLRMQEVDLVPLVAAAVDNARAAAAAKSVAIDTDSNVPTSTISGDPGRLHQVFANLLSNAVRFSDEGGRVGVRLRQRDGGIEVSISDEGRGIAEDAIPRLFEKFRSDDDPACPPKAGLGVGLPIARHLVEAHGGTLAGTSLGEGQGATFTVYLPELAVCTRPSRNPDSWDSRLGEFDTQADLGAAGSSNRS